MLLLAISAPSLSLCITITSVVCELAFLTASLTFLRYRACTQLRKHKRINIRAQHRGAVAVTLFAMLAFVAVETGTSLSSDAQSGTVIVMEPCVRNLFGLKADDDPFLSEAIYLTCARTESNTTVTLFEGNFRIETSDIVCDPRPMYSYVLGEEVDRTRGDAEISCVFNTCASADFRNNTLFMSGPHAKDDEKIPYFLTRINPNNTAQIDLKFIAETLVQSYTNSITEVGEIRRIALFGSVDTQCQYTRDGGPAKTSIRTGVIIVACLIWASSLLFFFASLFFRRRIFFDITHPMHWARKARHDPTHATGDDPKLQMEEIDGEICITVTGYLRNQGCQSESVMGCDNDLQHKVKGYDCEEGAWSSEELARDV